MAFDKLIDSAKLDAGMNATADAIRAKTGGTADIPWNETSGFASAIAEITPKLQAKTVTPKASSQTVNPDSGYDGLSQVTVNGDSDLKAANIAKGVNIFGVTGTFEGGSKIATGTFSRAFNQSWLMTYPVTITGLGFKPSRVIILYSGNGSYFEGDRILISMDSENNRSIRTIEEYDEELDNYEYYLQANYESGGVSVCRITFNSDGFTFTCENEGCYLVANSTYKYIAIG